MIKFLATKFQHWSYEQEHRCFLDLNEKDTGSEHYFCDFSESMVLKQVIVGACSDVTRHQLATALGSPSTTVETFKARPAFKTFKIVRNHDESLWC